MTIQRLLTLTDADIPEDARSAVGTYLVPAENLAGAHRPCIWHWRKARRTLPPLLLNA